MNDRAFFLPHALSEQIHEILSRHSKSLATWTPTQLHHPAQLPCEQS
jgi:hypothetical protein